MSEMEEWFNEVKALEEKLIKLNPKFKPKKNYDNLYGTSAVIFLFNYETLLRKELKDYTIEKE